MVATWTVDQLRLPDTLRLGERLGERLFPGAVIALNGTLGAGKTHFTRGIAIGLGIRNPFVVNSPTFVLIQEYTARLPIAHFDTYRLQSVGEFLDLGTAEYFDSDAVSIIEWAEKVTPALPVERLEIQITVVSPEIRTFRLTAMGERYESLLGALQLAWKSDAQSQSGSAEPSESSL
ncbi:tRNA (adenosine(37)-N6)-threonylcarbamoyltransferase complex ATPase subunit type 1 TsaE [Tuwongella immobilis]|uniref:tRNA threonylcarbamoyladenosine biosynthesis protein TsaE n=1 Tax=Tuwongella immobilis TaxID=692036 RepID=A0A6C2YP02_9BACT|nr:tRNA (adenosine(37)-N6)-threonylcarbamoyltransferase complex ATPase subunit type 1 TsaE [Tuwongella immobilis]VIP02785.1 atp-binding protein : Uncharacterized protein OS=Planctomyces maris DSM 8797 GN=PM8797T_32200 PE=4 SV=1: UPF0079 [Tuwongella immobilis]VTS02443.1 atp-binding protein : Uncharacterized protein OS=Planctomyces maris DSM 8797 GN=PM8797T_32200 PE=4 SV=1: UPF0079 [Tuwongella immobilis]